jgi:hypothetical protein
MAPEESDHVGVDWIHLTQDWVQRQSLCEHEIHGSKRKKKDFPDQLSDYQEHSALEKVIVTNVLNKFPAF